LFLAQFGLGRHSAVFLFDFSSYSSPKILFGFTQSGINALIDDKDDFFW